MMGIRPLINDLTPDAGVLPVFIDLLDGHGHVPDLLEVRAKMPEQFESEAGYMKHREVIPGPYGLPAGSSHSLSNKCARIKNVSFHDMARAGLS
jgi:hypothetical protein